MFSDDRTHELLMFCGAAAVFVASVFLPGSFRGIVALASFVGVFALPIVIQRKLGLEPRGKWRAYWLDAIDYSRADRNVKLLIIAMRVCVSSLIGTVLAAMYVKN